jgi:2-polyprenyl-6-methoxyphenol hydroxylase-like FAD-dependent oxidoreductase
MPSKDITHKQFAIVGGGIGGLTLAIALQRKGFDVTVYEQAPQIRPLGAGLGLAGNAVKALMEIGISDRVLRDSKIIKTAVLKDNFGKVLTKTNAEEISTKLGVVNSFTIHRADLHRILIENLQPETIQLNKTCIDFNQRENSVELKFTDGTTEAWDYVIAADGIHSAIRKKLLPHTTPRYAGYTCWRSVISEIPPGINMDELSETWGPGSRFGIVPLEKNRIYWFATVNATENNRRYRVAKQKDLLTIFDDYHPDVKNVLRATKDDQIIWSDIIDIKPIKQFAFGNIVLLGDAAHATTPNMGQGACMAIEDAATLANYVEAYDTPDEAFQRYEQKRIARTTKIVNDSWSFGKIAQWKNPLLVKIRNSAIRLTPHSVSEKQLRYLTDVSFK